MTLNVFSAMAGNLIAALIYNIYISTRRPDGDGICNPVKLNDRGAYKWSIRLWGMYLKLIPFL